MVNIQKKQERLNKLLAEIEEAKEKAHTELGGQIIEALGIDYEILGTKKEVSEAVELIVASLESNPFSDSEVEEKVSSENFSDNHSEENSQSSYEENTA